MPVSIGGFVKIISARCFILILITMPSSHSHAVGATDSSTAREIILPISAFVLFLGLGVLLIPLAGIQHDEAIFSIPIYEREGASFFSKIITLHLPLMIMDYVGALKTYLYYPIFTIFGVNVWSVRLPMVVAGALTIFSFYKLTELAVSRKAAAAGAFWLATDPLVLMTTTFDWGPVALEHLLLVTGCYFLWRSAGVQSHSGEKWSAAERYLAGGFLCFGLALWNKAIFSWALTGLTAASLVTLLPYLRRSLSRRNVAIAATAFAIGALPLILYNVKSGGTTFRSNTQLVPAEVPGKWIHVKLALQGSSVFGYIAAHEDTGASKPSQGGLAGKASAWLRERLGPRHSSDVYYVMGALLALVPLWWRSRAAWFSLVFCSVAWLMMAMTHNAGGSAHHAVLLWPFPILFAVAALDGLPQRVSRLALPGVALIVVTLNLAVVNQYFYQLRYYGSAGPFSDAIFALSPVLAEKTNSKIYLTDWGMSVALNMLHEGRLNMEDVSHITQAESPDPVQAEYMDKALRDSTGLFVSHLRGQEMIPNVGAHLDALAAQAGMRLEVVQTISDSNGRPIFEISRAVPAP